MFNAMPVGTVIAFAGQVDPVSGDANNRWKATKCGASHAASATKNTDIPLNHTETSGWMLCNGRSLSPSSYPELFAVLGYLYGKSGEEYYIPDYRGLFLRGVDAGSGMDPEAKNRTAATGDTQGEGIGSYQCDALESHTHNYKSVILAAPAQSGNAAGQASADEASSEPNAPAKTSSETRGKNIAVNYLIRFR